MMKAARRKLKKLWSRKKKKNKSHNTHHQQYQYNQPPEYHLPPPPPPNYHYRYTSCSSSVYVQPSAPPLPPNCPEAPSQPGPEGGIIEYSYSFLRQFEMHQHQGAEADDEQEDIIENSHTSSPVAVAYSDESQSKHQSIAYYDDDDALLYQKYLVPDPPPPPVYGVPIIQAPPLSVMKKTQTISGMLLACIVKLGASLFPCFCPCFHIREARCR